jgi:ABC-type amino acid transport system permease subunit
MFLALARRYGLRPYRYTRQRRTPVMLHVPESFLGDVLWPEFEALNEALVVYLSEVTARIIRDEVHGETGDAEERAEPGRLG